MTDDTILPFSFPAVHAKKITAAFDGGRLTSDGGVMLLAMAERRLGLADEFGPGVPGSARSGAGCAQPCRYVPRAHVRDLRGYEDAADLGRLRVRSRIQAGLRTTCRIPVAICVLSRPCRAWRMLRACAT